MMQLSSVLQESILVNSVDKYFIGITKLEICVSYYKVQW